MKLCLHHQSRCFAFMFRKCGFCCFTFFENDFSLLCSAGTCYMETRKRNAVYGWVRENYQSAFLDVISDIIYKYSLTLFESEIISSEEDQILMNLLFNHLKSQKGNEDISSIDTKLLYTCNNNTFDAKQFHNLCDIKELQ